MDMAAQRVVGEGSVGVYEARGGEGDVAVDVATRTAVGDVAAAAAAAVKGLKENSGQPLQMTPRDGHVGRHLLWLSHGGRPWACSCGRGRGGNRRSGGLPLRTMPRDDRGRRQLRGSGSEDGRE